MANAIFEAAFRSPPPFSPSSPVFLRALSPPHRGAMLSTRTPFFFFPPPLLSARSASAPLPPLAAWQADAARALLASLPPSELIAIYLLHPLYYAPSETSSGAASGDASAAAGATAGGAAGGGLPLGRFVLRLPHRAAVSALDGAVQLAADFTFDRAHLGARLDELTQPAAAAAAVEVAALPPGFLRLPK